MSACGSAHGCGVPAPAPVVFHVKFCCISCDFSLSLSLSLPLQPFILRTVRCWVSAGERMCTHGGASIQ